VFTAWAEISLTENHIRQLHRDLLRYSSKDEWHRGNYKTTPNNVVAVDADGREIGVVFQTASPFDTPRLMAELVLWLDSTDRSGSLHPLLAIGICIVVFLEIHPFQDGNGRLSRILTTLLLLRAGYAYVPYASLESIVEETKEAYYLALRRTQGTIRSAAPDWSPWLVYFLRALHQQVRRLRSKIDREALLAARLPTLSLRLLDHVKEHGRITMADAVALTGASRNTLKVHFRSLIEQGLLVLHGSGRGAWYSAR
jgi:Fic family protein